MKAILISAFLVSFMTLIPCSATGQSVVVPPKGGGRYHPPGDYVGPNHGGHNTPPGGDSGMPDMGGPPKGGAGGIKAPAGPANPTPAGAGRRGSAAGGMARKTKRSGSGLDRWELWWEFNKDPFLNLDNRFNEMRTRSGTSGFLVGRGRKNRALNTRAVTEEIIVNQIVPALRLCIDDEDLRLQSSAVLALARAVPVHQSKPVLDALKTRLSSKHLSMRQLVCLSIGLLRSPDGISLCRDLMSDNARGRRLVGGQKVNRLTSAWAALSLGLIGDSTSATHLREIIEKTDSQTGKDLIGCAILALGILGGADCRKDNVQFLIGILNDEKMDPFLRAFTPLALGKLGDRATLPLLTGCLKDTKKNQQIRQSCAIALGMLATVRDEEPIQTLSIEVRDGKDVQARRFALIALARIGARDSDFKSSEKVHRELCHLFRDGISKTGNSQDRSWASLAAAIHARKHPLLQVDVIESLGVAFKKANDPSEKSAEAIGLGLLGAESAGEMLFEELTGSKERLVKGYLCVALGLMNWKAAADEIRSYLEDRSLFSLRIQAATALGLMGDRNLMDLLVKPLEQNQHLYIMSSVSEALGIIGDRGAVSPLIKILENTETEILARSCAATALGLLGEKTDLPWSHAYAEDFNYCLQLDSLVNLFSIP